MSARLTPAFVTGLGSVRAFAPGTRASLPPATGHLGSTLGRSRITSRVPRFAHLPSAYVSDPEEVETVTTVDADGRPLEFDRVSLPLNNGSWCCTLGAGASIAVFAYEAVAGSGSYRIRVWRRSPWWADSRWHDATDAFLAALPELDIDLQTPVVATDPTDPDTFVIAAVATVTRSGTARPDHVVFARVRAAGDSDMLFFDWAAVHVASDVSIPDAEELMLPSVAVSPDGFAVIALRGVRSTDRTGNKRVALAWETSGGAFEGAIVYESTSRSANQPSVASGDTAVVLAWSVEETDETGAVVGRTLLSYAAPRSVSAGVNTVDTSSSSSTAATITGTDAGGDLAWDPSIVRVGDETWMGGAIFLVGFQGTGDEGSGVAIHVAATTDDGATWVLSLGEVGGATSAYNYFPSLGSLSARVGATWESRDTPYLSASTCAADVVRQAWQEGDTEFDPASAVSEASASSPLAFATFPTVSVGAYGTMVIWLGYDGTAGSETDLAFQSTFFADDAGESS